jgi:hypothetical protein
MASGMLVDSSSTELAESGAILTKEAAMAHVSIFLDIFPI